MSLVVLILGGLGAAAVVIAVVSRRRGRATQTAPPVVPVPTVELVALGVSGAGKTVYLASLFHELHVPHGDRPYFLTTSAEQRVALSGVLREVSDPTQPWPAGTAVGQTRTFGFDCLARSADEWTPVFRINYLDYAGELLEHSRTDATALHELEGYLGRADAVLGMLDGRRIAQYLRGEPAGRTYLHATVQPMLGLMTTVRGAIYLVITKWDIVRDFGEPEGADDNTRLDHVRQALLALPQLSGLAQLRGIVRLIPVSAVGDDFARVNPATGAIEKRADGTFRPTNVEIPVAAVLPDLFRRIDAALGAQTSAALDAQVRGMMRLTPAQWGSGVAQFMARPAGMAVRAALDAVVGRPYSGELVGMLIDWLGEPYRQKGEQVATFRSAAERQAAAVSQGRVAVLEHFRKTMYLFEARLPGSRLWSS